MNYIKTIKKLSIIAIMITHNSYATMDFDLSGGFQFFSGDVFDLEKNQNKKKKDLRAPRFMTKGHISVKGKHKLDDESSIGADINILTTAKPSFNNGTYIYYDSTKFGRIELGSMKDAGRKMQITSLSVSTSQAWKYFAPLQDSDYPNASFITNTQVFINKDSKNHEYSRKFSYFTPKIGDKLRVGISYIPDSENIGGGLINATHPNNYKYKLDDGSLATISSAVKNAICYGVSYESNISDVIDFKIALNGGITVLTPDGPKTMSGFLQIADAYSATKPGNLAYYYAGVCLMRLGKFQDAISNFERYSNDDVIVKSMAEGSIGDAYVELGKSNEGIDHYLKASKISNTFTSPLTELRFKIANSLVGFGYNTT